MCVRNYLLDTLKYITNRFPIFFLFQISLLIILDHSDGIQTDMGPCAEMVMQAAERLVTLGKERANKTADDVGFKLNVLIY